MNPHSHHPSLQRQWADEVLYLHSLWHLGPTPNPNPNSNLRPTHSAQFKKPHKPKPKTKEIAWPVNPEPEPTNDFTRWPDPNKTQKPNAPPDDNKEFLNVVQRQKNALKVSKVFFVKDLESDEELGEEEEEEAEAEEKAYEFFKEVFERDEELRGYYEKCWEKGGFYCLVCGGIGVKVGRMYGDCVALVQHSVKVLRTKRKGAHRGFGKAVCGVLGWDVNRLPSVGCDVGERTNRGAEMEEDLQKDVLKKTGGTSNGSFQLKLNLHHGVQKDDSDEDLVDFTNREEQETPTKDEQVRGIKKKKNNKNYNAGPNSVELQVQQNGLNTCREFLAKSEDDSSSDDECEKEELEKRESIAFKFFSVIFERDRDLKDYYVKNYAKGEFHCLVCGGIGIKNSKFYENCYRLVQHSRGVPFRKKRWAHRAFGRVICQVLGWDIPQPWSLDGQKQEPRER